MKKVKNSWGVSLLMLCFLLTGNAYALPTSGTGSMSSVSDALNNPATSTSGVRHTLNFDPSSIAPINAVEITIHAPSDAPASAALYSMAGASLTSQTVWGSGTYSTNIASNVLTVVRNEGAVAPNGGTLAVVLDALTNPSTLGTYYVTIATRNGGAYVDSATTSFLLSNPGPVGATVAPYFSFAVSENGVKDNPSDDTGNVSIELGGITSTPTSHPISGGGRDGHRLTVTTNAPNGYTVTVRDNPNGLVLNGATGVTSAMRSVNDATAPENPVLFDYTSNTAPVQGTEAFYFTVTGMSSALHIASTLSQYNGLSGLVAKTIISAPSAVVNDIHEVLFNAQSHEETPAGAYSNTITYTATPNF